MIRKNGRIEAIHIKRGAIVAREKVVQIQIAVKKTLVPDSQQFHLRRGLEMGRNSLSKDEMNLFILEEI